jgi:hypothetical protein
MSDDLTIEFEFRNRRFRDASRGLDFLSNELEKNPKKLTPILRTNLLEYLQAIANALAKKHGTPWPGGTTPTTLSKRSGKGVASIKSSVRVSGNSLASIRGLIGGAAHLRIQETGGTITPKKSKYLTIPLPAALNANGTPKKKSARQWANTFVIKSKKGNLLIVRKVGTSIEPLYVLKKSVYIPPRLGMERALVGGLDYFIDETIDKMAREILDVG